MNNSKNKRLPPHNIIIEVMILGYLLCNKIIQENILHSLNPNFFVLQKHKVLFNHIIKVNKIHKSNQIKQLINTLWLNKLLKTTGGITYIFYIIEQSQSILSYNNHSLYIEYFIEILQYYYAKRLFIQYSYSIFELNYLNQLSIKQIYNKSINYLNIIKTSIYINKKSGVQDDISLFLNKILKSHKNNPFITSGFQDLDKIIQGFKTSELIILAGRPSMGKTSFAINITYHILFKLKLAVHIFSLEMSKNEILDKLISIASNITLHNIKNKNITQKNWFRLQQICQFLISLPLNIDDQGNASINYIKSQCKNYIIKKKQQL